MQVCQAREQYVRWLLVARDLSPHTIRAYESDIAALERHLGSRGRVAQLDRHQLVAFIEEQRVAGLSASWIRRRTSGLRGFCKWLMTSGLLQSDPLADIAIRGLRSRRLPRLLRTHELDRLLRRFKRRPPSMAQPTPTSCSTHPTTARPCSRSHSWWRQARVNEVVSIRCLDQGPNRGISHDPRPTRHRTLAASVQLETRTVDGSRNAVEADQGLACRHACLRPGVEASGFGG